MPIIALHSALWGTINDPVLAPDVAIVDFDQVNRGRFRQPWFERWDVDVLHWYQLPWYTPPPSMGHARWKLLDVDEERNHFLYGVRGIGRFQYIFVVTSGIKPPAIWLLNLLIKRNEVVLTPGSELVTLREKPRMPRGKVTPEVLQ